MTCDDVVAAAAAAADDDDDAIRLRSPTYRRHLSDAFSLTDSLPLPLADRAGNQRDGILRMLPPASTNVDDSAAGSLLGPRCSHHDGPTPPDDRPWLSRPTSDPSQSLNALTAGER